MSIKNDNINRKISFEKVVGEYTLYKVTDPNFYSVFNIKMDYVRVVAKDDKVYAIEAFKIVKAINNEFVVLNTTELEIIQQGLISLFGSPSSSLEENNTEYSRIGVQWESKSKLANCFIDYYGAAEGYMLQFSMCEYKLDF